MLAMMLALKSPGTRRRRKFSRFKEVFGATFFAQETYGQKFGTFVRIFLLIAYLNLWHKMKKAWKKVSKKVMGVLLMHDMMQQKT